MATYNQRQLVNNILGKKNEWDNATDDNARQQISQSAQKYYEQLRNSGDSVLADNLSARNAVDAQKYADNFYKITGKTQARPYLASKAKAYGLSEDAINKAITFDESTGTVSLGGKNLGTPHSIVNGTSYWDQAKLDDAWDSYVKDTRLNKTLASQVDGAVSQLFGRWDEAFTNNNKNKEDLWKERQKNPFTSDETKAILDYYGIQGDNAALNAAATAASGNGGNIDSFAAANARRNKQATLNRGLITAMDYNDRKLSGMSEDAQNQMTNAINLLQGMGVQIQGIGDLDIRRKQADADNEAKHMDTLMKQAEITGIVPDELLKNPYIDDSGNLINPDWDYQAIMDKAKENNDLVTYNFASQARTKKMNDNPDKYGQYDTIDNPVIHATMQTAKLRENAQDRSHEKTLTQMQIDNSEKLAKMGYDDAAANRTWQSGENAADRQNSLDVIGANGQNAINQINAEGNAAIAQYTAQTNDDIRHDNNTANLTAGLQASQKKSDGTGWATVKSSDIKTAYNAIQAHVKKYHPNDGDKTFGLELQSDGSYKWNPYALSVQGLYNALKGTNKLTEEQIVEMMNAWVPSADLDKWQQESGILTQSID